VCELMLELRKFASMHQCMHVPVVVAGDWNAESMQRLRFMALAMFSLQSIVDHAHPLLLGDTIYIYVCTHPPKHTNTPPPPRARARARAQGVWTCLPQRHPSP